MQQPPFTESQVRAAIAGAESWADALRALGYRPAGHNMRTLQRYVRLWRISTNHFDANAARRRSSRGRRVPLTDIVVERSSYSRNHLKRRLFDEGVKARQCEICGQGEMWLGRPMSLILDHINGVADDHRLENLRIVCPNCARHVRHPLRPEESAAGAHAELLAVRCLIRTKGTSPAVLLELLRSALGSVRSRPAQASAG